MSRMEGEKIENTQGGKDPAIERELIWQDALKVLQDSKELKDRMKTGSERFGEALDEYERRLITLEQEITSKVGTAPEEEAKKSIDQMKNMVESLRKKLLEIDTMMDEFLRKVSDFSG